MSTETVHVHKRPAPGWLGECFTTDQIAGGYLQEDGRDPGRGG